MLSGFKRFYSAAAGSIKKTPLYDEHVKLGGKMVPFAGYSMPVLYDGQSHIDSHKWTRAHCGVFDVSHMLQHNFVGKDTIEFLQKMCPTDFTALEPFQASLSVLLHPTGGIVDDCMVTKHTETEFYMVSNAATRQKDCAYIDSMLGEFGRKDVKHDTFEGILLAIQGPTAKDVMAKFTTTNLKDLYFGHAKYIDLKGFGTSDKFHIARSGYTGEDGFEISIPNDTVGVDFFKALMEESEVKPIGLAARDSLRLEAGMCLYGSELNDETTPIDGSLNWLVSKSRRTPEAATFNGASKILAQLADPKSVRSKRVGIVSKGPAPRHGCKVYAADEPTKLVGEITSGSFSPSTGHNVAQGYLQKPYNKKGTEILIDIRGKLRKATVAKMPFVEPSYYKP